VTVEERKQERILAWEGCRNVRDLGGYPTEDGRETQWGAVIRADNLSTLTERGQADLVNFGVHTIIDLRTAEELQRYPNPFAQPGEHGITYTNISFVDPAAGPKADFTSLANDYKDMLDRFQHRVVEVMKTIADAPPGGVLVHCMGGKDRTGLISALLLDLVGVPRDVIGADYALTAECLKEVDEEYLEHGPGDRAERERNLALYSPRAEVMQDVLTHLDQRYGGTEAYLRHGGVTVEEIGRLRRRLVPEE